jgi:hypothetical protein
VVSRPYPDNFEQFSAEWFKILSESKKSTKIEG